LQQICLCGDEISKGDKLFNENEFNSGSRCTECQTGYVNVGNNCVDICIHEGINCGIGGTCLAGNCTCQTGYVNVGNNCVDICIHEGITCGIGGTCLAGNCTCQTGYAYVGNNCKETCALNPCKELIKK